MTKDLIKCLFKGVICTYIGSWILIYGIEKAYQMKQFDHLLLKIVDETTPKEIAFNKPENEVRQYGQQKM
jgi:hypothetical protein